MTRHSQVLLGITSIALATAGCATEVSRYFEGGAGGNSETTSGAGGTPTGSSTGPSSTSTSMSPCTIPCFSDECCTADGECVAGTTNDQCGGDGEMCSDCTATNRTCSAAGPSLGDDSRACLPTCSGTHFRATPFTQPLYFGLSALDDLCATAFGPSWHVADYKSNAAIAHGGSTIAGVCDGDWCQGIDWGSVELILSAGSCDGFTSIEGGATEGILDFCSFTSNVCDCANLTACENGNSGILCTDL